MAEKTIGFILIWAYSEAGNIWSVEDFACVILKLRGVQALKISVQYLSFYLGSNKGAGKKYANLSATKESHNVCF